MSGRERISPMENFEISCSLSDYDKLNKPQSLNLVLMILFVIYF